MTAAEFTSLLTDNSTPGLSELELENALTQFPYCQPLRFLLLRKYHQSQNSQKVEQLQLAATYAADRSFLFHLLSDEPASEITTESTEDIEISGIAPGSGMPPVEVDSVHYEKIQDAEEPANNEIEKIEGEQPFDLTIVSDPLKEDIGESPQLEGEIQIALDEAQEEASEMEDAKEVPEEEIPEEEIPKEEAQEEEEIQVEAPLEIDALNLASDDLADIPDKENNNVKIVIDDEGSLDLSGVLSLEERALPKVKKKQGKAKKEKKNRKEKKRKKSKETKIAPSNKELPTPPSFIEWLSSLSSSPATKPETVQEKKPNKDELQSEKKSKPKPKKKRKVVELARQSVTDHEGIVSETLAKLLTLQGNHAKAIAMYERLILKFPEKSTYFAVKIEDLKSKQ